MQLGLLQGTRVLDLTTGRGLLCGRMLADLGADVVKIERPGGDPARKIPPFYHGVQEQGSLYWFAYNVNKRGITLNIQSPEGKRILKSLASRADVLIESFDAGCLDQLGLGYESLRETNPGIILTSISPYGQSGPRSNYAACDLTLMAAGGFEYITGVPERPPLRVSFPQSWLLASAQAAAATMIAYHYRKVHGRGQHVDVSVQASVAWSISYSVPHWVMGHEEWRRQGPVVEGLHNVKQRSLWPCAEGSVMFVVHGGRTGARNQTALVKWMEEENMADPFISGFDWTRYDLSRATQEEHDRLEGYFGRFFLAHTAADLYRGAMQRDVLIYPVRSPKEICGDEQLMARGFWVDIEHPDLGDFIRYPGAFCKSTDLSPSIRRRPPQVGEHNHEVYEEIGISDTDVERLRHDGVI